MSAIADGSHYRDALMATKQIVEILGKDGVVEACDPAKYVGPVDEIIDAVRAETEGL